MVDQHPIQGGVEMLLSLLVTSCYGNWDKLRSDGPLSHLHVTCAVSGMLVYMYLYINLLFIVVLY